MTHKTFSILIVEDELMVQNYLRKNLSRFYTIAGTAVSGEAAISQAESLKPDLVLMDIKLEGSIDGVEAAKTISEKLNIPVLFITAQNDDVTLERVKMAKPFGYILKPVDFSVLKTNIDIAMAMYKALEKVPRSKFHAPDSVKDNSYLNSINHNISQPDDKIDIRWAEENKKIEIVNNKFLRQYWILED